MRITIITGYYRHDIDKAVECFDNDTMGVEVIEYPEVYRHPQELVEKLKYYATNVEFRYIIKTLSDIPINAFGIMIYKGIIDKDDVTLYYLDKDHAVYHTDYTEQGFLEDFPMEFFFPKYE